MSSLLSAVSVLRVLAANLAVSMSIASAQQPTQASSPSDREAAWRMHQQLLDSSPLAKQAWRAVGPRQQGGRIEAIAVHPQRSSTMYVGPGSGNLWKTTNAGLSWRPIFEKQSAFSIGAIAIAPSNPDVVWVGTGESQPRHSGYSYAGSGVFVSLDGGEKWRHCGLWDTHHIGRIVVHPRDPDTAWVAAIGHFWSANEERGVFKTGDGGASWQKVLYVDSVTGAVDLAIDPKDPNLLYAAMWQLPHGAGSGLYRSQDGGESWSPMTNGLPAGPLGRAGLDVAQSRSGTVYAFVDNHGDWHAPEPVAGETIKDKKKREQQSRNRNIAGAELYHSEDRGESWQKANRDDLWDVFKSYGWKFCDVRVNPQDADEVYVFGNHGYRSVDGGRTFARIGEDIQRLQETRGRILHLDHHDLWIDPRDPAHVVLANDGGLFVSWDHAQTWLHLNNLPIGEFYSVAVDDGDPYTIYGGTQDNAALYGPATAIESHQNDPWRHVFLDPWTGGDAFVTLPDPTREGIVYYEHQHGAMRAMDLRGGDVQSWGKASRSIRPSPGKSNAAQRGPKTWRFGWYAPFLISQHDPNKLIAGGNAVFCSGDRGATWSALSEDLSDPEAAGERAVVPFGTITMLADSSADRLLLYAGTEAGRLHRTLDGGATWSEVGRSNGLPHKWVSRVVASQHVDARVYVTLHGLREDDFRAYVFVSDDHGKNWQSLHEALPAAAVHVIREDPRSADVLYLGSDLGVYVSRDRGVHWHVLGADLPTTPVHDLALQENALELVAATHGRSVFVLDVAPVVPRR
ncbi:MAG: WD40/YVTN/BNR-like repeat-containing protein [Planctomycetota bacterium]